MDRILDALQEAIKKDLKLISILMPQKPEGNTAQIQLSFSGIKANGESSTDDSVSGTESITLNALYVISGTHKKWINKAILDSKKLCKLVESQGGKMPIVVKVDTEKTKKLYALWNRQGDGKFVYPDDEEKSMPVSYVENYKIDIRFPTDFLGGDNESNW